MGERQIPIICPCGARLTVITVPDTWEGESRTNWQICYNCNKKVAYSHNERRGHAWYVRENPSSSSYNDEDSGSSGGGCFITTAVCQNLGKADDCYELTAFRNFCDTWLANQSDGKALIAEYYNTAPKIVEKINQLPDAAKVYKNIWNDYLKSCLNFIEHGENRQCKEIYIRMVNNLKSMFLG